MLNMTWEFKLEPTAEQVSEIEPVLPVLDVCRNVWNFALRERKDWLDARKSLVNACSMRFAKTSQPEFITATIAGQSSPVIWRVAKLLLLVGNEWLKLPGAGMRRGRRSLSANWHLVKQEILGATPGISLHTR